MTTKQSSPKEDKRDDLFLKFSFCYDCHQNVKLCKCRISKQILHMFQFRKAISETRKETAREIFKDIDTYCKIISNHCCYNEIDNCLECDNGERIIQGFSITDVGRIRQKYLGNKVKK